MTADLRLHDRAPTSWSGRKASRSPRSSSLAIVVTSLLSRAIRSTELRIDTVRPGPSGARPSCDEVAPDVVRIIAHRPDKRDGARSTTRRSARRARTTAWTAASRSSSWRWTRATPRSSRGTWRCAACEVGRHRILRCKSPAMPNAIAALLLHVRDRDRHDPPRLLRLDRGQSRSRTPSATWPSGRATPRPSRARSCARRSATRSSGRASTSGDGAAPPPSAVVGAATLAVVALFAFTPLPNAAVPPRGGGRGSRGRPRPSWSSARP